MEWFWDDLPLTGTNGRAAGMYGSGRRPLPVQNLLQFPGVFPGNRDLVFQPFQEQAVPLRIAFDACDPSGVDQEGPVTFEQCRIGCGELFGMEHRVPEENRLYGFVP